MIPRAIRFLPLGALMLVGACARGRAPATTPAPADTTQRVTPVNPVDTTRRPPPGQTLPAPTTPPTTPAAPAATKGKEGQRCVLDLENTDDTRAFIGRDASGRNRVVFAGGGIFGRCRGQDITIVADSAESYEASQLHILIGNVHYREPRASIDAQRVTYYRAEERFLFENAVKAEMRSSGGTMTGPRAEYFRPVVSIRPRERLVATGRPTLTVVEKDSLGQPQPPITMNANTIVGEGDSTFYGSGQVEVIRTDLTAHGDSVMMNGTRRFSRLLRKPVIESKGSQPYTLRGKVIEMYGAAKAVDRVVALDSASAVSKDLTLTSDTIDLRIKTNKLDRAFAFGPAGATANSAERTVIADSLDILMPNQRIRVLRAIGKAYVESDPDPAKIVSDERDWLRGDTVIATFDSVAASDTTSRPQMKSVVATGSASAFYQVPPNRSDSAARARSPADSAARTRSPADSTAHKPAPTGRPGINYTRGRVIQLDLEKGEVQTVTVTDQASGVYLEPSAAADSAHRRTPSKTPPKTPVRRPPRLP